MVTLCRLPPIEFSCFLGILAGVPPPGFTVDGTEVARIIRAHPPLPGR